MDQRNINQTHSPQGDVNLLENFYALDYHYTHHHLGCHHLRIYGLDVV
jgi:hypothetical protein